MVRAGQICKRQIAPKDQQKKCCVLHPYLTISMAIGMEATSRTTMKPRASRKRSPRASRKMSTMPQSRNDRICGPGKAVRACCTAGLRPNIGRDQGRRLRPAALQFCTHAS